MAELVYAVRGIEYSLVWIGLILTLMLFFKNMGK